MAFLTDDDYSVQVRSEILQVIQTNGLSRPIAENMAQEEISSYLRPRGIDVDATFSAAGADRNPFVIMRMIDIVLYHLHSSISSRALPKPREDRYTAAIDWLTKVSSGLLDPNLPLLADTSPPDENEEDLPTLRLGSDPYYNSRW